LHIASVAKGDPDNQQFVSDHVDNPTVADHKPIDTAPPSGREAGAGILR
jgi:hypothetical protein